MESGQRASRSSCPLFLSQIDLPVPELTRERVHSLRGGVL
ncbi:MAG: hypothetical protein RLZZ399_2406, partial [Verrucomicrobiota bacterium]